MGEVGRWVAVATGTLEGVEHELFLLRLAEPDRQTRIVPLTECVPGDDLTPDLTDRLLQDNGVRLTLDDVLNRTGTTRDELEARAAGDRQTTH